MTGRRVIRVQKDVLAKNEEKAAGNRSRFSAASVSVLNFVSSPGAGKTSLLVKTIDGLRGRARIGVIEGDQETDNDARRIAATGALVTQINTASACHLDASMVDKALDEMSLDGLDMLFIENVGNLVCPASYDLGEDMKVVVMSVTEGDDKPVKYPKMFRACSVMVISKIDLLPHVDFSVARAIENARLTNPDIEVFELSAKTGEGLESWRDYLMSRAR